MQTPQKITILPAAIKDLENCMEFYERQSAGSGSQGSFILEVPVFEGRALRTGGCDVSPRCDVAARRSNHYRLQPIMLLKTSNFKMRWPCWAARSDSFHRPRT